MMSLDVQRRLFALALDHLGKAEPINEVIQVMLLADRTVRIDRYDLPSGK
jgi:hypothetical protein